jgi:hypothetical protein
MFFIVKLLFFIVFEELVKIARKHTVIKLSDLVGTPAVECLKALV